MKQLKRVIGGCLLSALVACSSEPADLGEAENVLDAAADEVAQTESTAEPDQPAAEPINTSLIPADFDAPVLVEAEGFKIVPLGPDLVEMDFAAYMSSIEHLQKTFTRSTSWPHEGITDADAMLDMQTEQARFEARESFAYAVLTPDGTRERGCVYVHPSQLDGYDAQVRMWVTKAEFDAGFDAQLFEWAKGWVESDWPFEKVAYPGRDIPWSSWDEQLAQQEEQEAALLAENLTTAEAFIDAFYSFDADRLKAFMTETDETAARIAYYQGWAEGGNYAVIERNACAGETPTLIECAITVQDDPVLALKTGFNVTDTFHITFADAQIASIRTSSNDQPIYYEARKWVEANLPEVMSGPCLEGGDTPGDCARAMTEGYKKFYAATQM